MMQEERIRVLVLSYINNTSTPEELRELETLFASAQHSLLLKKLLQESYYSIKQKDTSQNIGMAAKERIFNYVTNQQQETPSIKPIKIKWWISAAAILIILGMGTFFYQQSQIVKPAPKTVKLNHIMPGGNKAYLTLANGEKVSLTDAANGNIAEQAGLTIIKTKDGQLVYNVQKNNTNNAETRYNTIETPKGGQYQIRLPDGTIVWLNAASSLKYPTSFAANKERRVQLNGEGYFEVAKDKNRPFIVSANKQEVEVLGTHFNINAYADENNIKTTLLEGSVKVGNLNSETKVLKPGEQSTNTGGNLQVAQVNTNDAIAWKEGYFRFNGKTLETGLREIARWYNVKITYKNERLKNEPLAGRISKYNNIQQVLKKIELAGIINFTIRGQEIIVE